MAASSIVNLSYPKPREALEKVVKILRTDTTAFQAAVLPKDSMITGIYVIGAAVSDSATSASVGIGSTSSANEFMTGFDVKTAATGEGYNIAGAAAVGSALMTKFTADTPIYGKYTEVGTATTGGPWYVKIEYIMTGPGEDVQM